MRTPKWALARRPPRALSSGKLVQLLSASSYCPIPHHMACNNAHGRCHYTGRLSSNGQVFDSSYERRRPLSFTIGVRQVIQGWDLGIVGTDDIPAMKEGGKRR